MAHDSQPERMIELDEHTCRQLLASHDVGRIAINADPSPEVLPVNYALRGDDIVFRTARGIKQTAAKHSRAATFEVDGVDRERRSAWSIVIRGSLEAVPEGTFQDLPEPLVGGDRPVLVRLRILRISGRRIPPAAGWPIPGRSWAGQDASDLMG